MRAQRLPSILPHRRDAQNSFSLTGCASEFFVAPGADTQVCPYAFRGSRWRGAPACTPDAGLVQNGDAHLR